MRLMRRCAIHATRGASAIALYTFTGTHTASSITVNGVNRTLVQLTSSGLFQLSEAATVQIFLVGGGGSGSRSSFALSGTYLANGGQGGGSGYITSATSVNLTTSSVNVTIGTGGVGDYGSGSAGSTTIFSTYRANGGSCTATGGSCGGTAVRYKSSGSYTFYSRPSGSGVNTYPFGQASLYAHAGGGGGGGLIVTTQPVYYNSADGGTLGGQDGGITSGSGSVRGGFGGVRGGGNGGDPGFAGSPATFFGSGGGGGGVYYTYSSSTSTAAYGGDGYQGVVYVLI